MSPWSPKEPKISPKCAFFGAPNEAWEASGAVWTPERAYKLYEQILHEFSEPLIDQGIEEELREFVDRRKAEGGAPTDF